MKSWSLNNGHEIMVMESWSWNHGHEIMVMKSRSWNMVMVSWLWNYDYGDEIMVMKSRSWNVVRNHGYEIMAMKSRSCYGTSVDKNKNSYRFFRFKKIWKSIFFPYNQKEPSERNSENKLLIVHAVNYGSLQKAAKIFIELSI